eukprot:6332758-Lingulodinium_polyedra.AAC.1
MFGRAKQFRAVFDQRATGPTVHPTGESTAESTAESTGVHSLWSLQQNPLRGPLGPTAEPTTVE